MQRIYDNKSLKFIVNSFNNGLVPFVDVKKLKIVSSSKPHLYIKIIEVSVEKYVLDMMKSKPSEMKRFKNAEVSFYDFVVFATDGNSEGETLMVTSLFELLLMSGEFVEESNVVGELTEGNMVATDPAYDSMNIHAAVWDLIEE